MQPLISFVNPPQQTVCIQYYQLSLDFYSIKYMNQFAFKKSNQRNRSCMPYQLGAIVVTSSIRALWGWIKLINLTKTQHLSFSSESIFDYMDLDESDVVQPDLVYSSSSHYWFSDDNTGTTIQHCGNRWCWERGPFTELKAAGSEGSMVWWV